MQFSTALIFAVTLAAPYYETTTQAPSLVESCNGIIVPVQEGDTALSLGQFYDPETTLESIILANPHIQNLDLISPGDELCIPEIPQKACSGTLYTIQDGDSLFNLINIGQFKGIPFSSVQEANPDISDFGLLTPGQIICFPAA